MHYPLPTVILISLTNSADEHYINKLISPAYPPIVKKALQKLEQYFGFSL
jgi:hypothetical protein